jgi:hypothetical protein
VVWPPLRPSRHHGRDRRHHGVPRGGEGVGDPAGYAPPSDWRDFAAWCASRGATALPAHVGIVAAYLSGLADNSCKSSTIRRKAVAIVYRHKLAGHGLRVLIRRSRGDQEGQGAEVTVLRGYLPARATLKGRAENAR